MASRIKIRISSDTLEARAVIGEGAPLEPEELGRALEAAGVVHGLEASVVEETARHLPDDAFTADVVVARGRVAVHGEDSWLETLFESGPVSGEEHEDGRIDYRERGLLVPVVEGRVLARAHGATAGEDGLGVDGRVLAAKPGTTVAVNFGEGVRREGDELIAARDGVVTQQRGDRLDVVDVVEHSADVDYASGSLDMNGSIVVNGTVAPSFEVRATGDVILHGDLDGGVVRAGGSVVVDRSALGGHTSGRIRAGRDVCCRVARRVDVRAGGTIEIERECIDSRLSGRKVVADGGSGRFRGGEVRAAETIRIDEGGSDAGVMTKLVVAATDEAEARVAAADRTDASRRRVARKRNVGGGPTGKGGKAARAGLQSDEEKIQARLALRRLRRELLAAASIEVIGTLHAGVSVVFGERELGIQESLQGVRFRWDTETRTILKEERRS